MTTVMFNPDLTKKILDLQDVQALKPDFAKLSILDRQVATKIELVIFDGEQHTLRILTTNNFPTQLQQVLDRLANQGYKCELYYTDPEGFKQALSWYTAKEALEQAQKAKISAEKNAAGNTALAMIKTIFDERSKRQESEFVIDMVRLAFQSGASDLHFQSEEQGVVVRVRIDGVLHTILEFSHTEFKRYLQALKFMAGTKMNIDFVPQDGRFSFTIGEGETVKKIDARVNFMPGIQDESTVIRFLDSVKGIRSFEEV
jgi:type II secretory ATPase GspE/PulE/Tfp pilus assembly ATPase PilB-like protein